MNSKYIEINSIKLHCLENLTEQNNQKISILFISGMLGHAEQYQTALGSFTDRYCIALSLRGRGKSDAPKKGYSYEDHVSDIMLCCNQIFSSPFIIVAHSVGVPYSLGYALKKPKNLKGLILIDYPAVYIPPSEKWSNNLLDRQDINKHLIMGLRDESRVVLLWNKLNEIQYPILVFRGGKDGALLGAEDSKIYKDSLDNIEIKILENSGHEPSPEDYSVFINAIKSFINKIKKCP